MMSLAHMGQTKGTCTCIPLNGIAYPSVADPQKAIQDIHHAKGPVQRGGASADEDLLDCCQGR